MPKIVATMIVYNEEEYLPYSLSSIYPYVDRIVIVEGAIQKLIDAGFAPPTGESTDKTNEIIKNFPDPNKKIIVQHGKFKHKNHQRNECLKYLSHEDWILIVDADEIYSEINIKNLIRLPVKFPDIDIIIYPMYHFYDFDKHIEMIKYMERLVRYVNNKGYHYPDSDTGQAIRDSQGRALWLDSKYRKVVDNTVYAHHYSRMKKYQMQLERTVYYYMRDSGLPREKAMELAKKDQTINHDIKPDNIKILPWNHKDHPEVIKKTDRYLKFIENKKT